MSDATKTSDQEASAARWSEFLGIVRAQLTAGTKLTEHEVLGPRTTMRVGGPARVYAEPAAPEDLRHLLVAADRLRLPVLLLGRGLEPDHTRRRRGRAGSRSQPRPLAGI
jgi:hypothetical protein